MLYMHKYEELYDKKVRNHVHTREEGYLQVEKKSLFICDNRFYSKISLSYCA